MKKFLYLCLLILFIDNCNNNKIVSSPAVSTISSIETSISIIQSPINGSFNSIHFKDSMTGIAVGENGIAIKTIDGGATWTQLNTQTSISLRSVFIVNSKIAYIAGGCYITCSSEDTNIIIKTVDGGETWSKLDIPQNASDFRSIFFYCDSTGFIAGNPGYIATRDGGKSWLADSSQCCLNNAFFLSPQDGYFCGFGGIILKTIDGGDTWQKIDLHSNDYMYQVFFPSLNIGYAIGASHIYPSVA